MGLGVGRGEAGEDLAAVGRVMMGGVGGDLSSGLGVEGDGGLESIFGAVGVGAGGLTSASTGSSEMEMRLERPRPRRGLFLALTVGFGVVVGMGLLSRWGWFECVPRGTVRTT